jgi:kynureninase
MPILSTAAIEAGVADVLDAGIDRIRKKSVQLSEYLIKQVDQHLTSLGFEVASPRDPARRGSHVSVSHQDAWPITRALIETASVIPDFRNPDSLRFGLTPLYTGFVDVHTAIQRLRGVVTSGSHEAYTNVTAAVT